MEIKWEILHIKIKTNYEFSSLYWLNFFLSLIILFSSFNNKILLLIIKFLVSSFNNKKFSLEEFLMNIILVWRLKEKIIERCD